MPTVRSLLLRPHLIGTQALKLSYSEVEACLTGFILSGLTAVFAELARRTCETKAPAIVRHGDDLADRPIYKAIQECTHKRLMYALATTAINSEAPHTSSRNSEGVRRRLLLRRRTAGTTQYLEVRPRQGGLRSPSLADLCRLEENDKTALVEQVRFLMAAVPTRDADRPGRLRRCEQHRGSAVSLFKTSQFW